MAHLHSSYYVNRATMKGVGGSFGVDVRQV